MKPLLIAAFCAAFAAPALALSPDEEAFLKGIGLDPKSEKVRLAEQDGVIDTVYRGDPRFFSLTSLIAQKLKNGVIAFVTTRHFIRQLEADPSTPIPKSHYDGMYLTIEQRKMVARKIAEGI